MRGLLGESRHGQTGLGCVVMGNVEFDHLIKVVSARFLYGKSNVSFSS